MNDEAIVIEQSEAQLSWKPTPEFVALSASWQGKPEDEEFVREQLVETFDQVLNATEDMEILALVRTGILAFVSAGHPEPPETAPPPVAPRAPVATPADSTLDRMYGGTRK